MEKIVSSKNFLTQAVATTGFLFELKRQAVSNPYAPVTEKELLAKLKNPENRKSLEMQMR